MKKITLFILTFCFMANLSAQTPITVNEMFDRAVTINYADIPKAVEIDFHDGSTSPVTGDDLLLGSSEKEYHARAFRINLAEGEALRVSYQQDYNIFTYFFKKNNGSYIRANDLQGFLTSVQINGGGEYYIVLAGEYGKDFEKYTLKLDPPAHFYTVSELFDQATAVTNFPFSESEKLNETNFYFVAGGTDGIGYSGISFLVKAYKFTLDEGRSVLLSHSLKETSFNDTYIFAEEDGQYKLVQKHDSRITKALFKPSKAGTYLVVTANRLFASYYNDFNYSFEIDNIETPVSLDELAKIAEPVVSLPFSFERSSGNEVQSALFDSYGTYCYVKAFKVQLKSGEAVKANFSSGDANASFGVYFYRNGFLSYPGSFSESNTMRFIAKWDGEYVIMVLTQKPLATIGFKLDIVETEAPIEMDKFFENATPLSYDNMPYSAGHTLGLPPSKLVNLVDNTSGKWQNALAYKVTMKANDKIRIDLKGDNVEAKVYRKTYSGYYQISMNDNMLYIYDDDDYYITIASALKNGNNDCSLKISRITGFNTFENIFDDVKPVGPLPCRISGAFDENSKIIHEYNYQYYVNTYSINLVAGTAVLIDIVNDFNINSVSFDVYQKVGNEYKMAKITPSYPSYGFPKHLTVEETGNYYMVISSYGLKTGKYDFSITKSTVLVDYKTLIDATPNITSLPFVGSGTLNDPSATLVKGDWYFGTDGQCHFTKAYKVKLESGAVLEYNLTPTDVGKVLYIYNSGTYSLAHISKENHGSYRVTESGDYHILVAIKRHLAEGDYTLKLRTFTTVPIETILENARPVSNPASFADVLGGGSEPCMEDNEFIWYGYDNYYFAKAYKLHLDQDECVNFEAKSDFLYLGISLARKNLRGQFVKVLSANTLSFKYTAKESGDYYLIVTSSYGKILTPGDYTLTITPFASSTTDDLFANAKELFFDENESCFVSGSLGTASPVPSDQLKGYTGFYYFADAYKMNLDAGTHITADIQTARCCQYLYLYKKEGNDYRLINSDGYYDRQVTAEITEAGEYYFVTYVEEYYGARDYTLQIKAFAPITLDDLLAGATEFTLPSSLLGTLDVGKTPYVSINGYYSIAQSYKTYLTAKKGLTMILSSPNESVYIQIYKRKDNDYEIVGYLNKQLASELDPGEYYFVVLNTYNTDSKYILNVDSYVLHETPEKIFDQVQVVYGNRDLPYMYACNFVKHTAPTVTIDNRTCKAKAFKLVDFSTEEHRIELDNAEKHTGYFYSFLYLYEKNGAEYTLVDMNSNRYKSACELSFIPVQGKEYYLMAAAYTYYAISSNFTLKITNTKSAKANILDIKLQGGNHLRIPSTATVEDIKELLSGKQIIPKVDRNEIAPVVKNSVSNWTVNQSLTQATGVFEAPAGYRFVEGVGTITVYFNGSQPKVSGITLDTKSTTLAVRSTKQLTATVTPGGAAEKSIIWESSNPNVAHVDIFTGEVTGVSPGNVFIYAKSLEDTYCYDFCVVTVEGVPVSGISLNKTAATITVNNMELLIAIVNPDNAYFEELIWSSNDPSIALADRSGTVTGMSEGTANVTVTTDDGKYSATCVVTVVNEVTATDDPENKPLLVYPNPARDIVRISGLEGGEILHIVDMSGKLMKTYKLTSGEGTINVSQLLQGTYLLRVSKSKTQMMIKLVIVR